MDRNRAVKVKGINKMDENMMREMVKVIRGERKNEFEEILEVYLTDEENVLFYQKQGFKNPHALELTDEQVIVARYLLRMMREEWENDSVYYIKGFEIEDFVVNHIPFFYTHSRIVEDGRKRIFLSPNEAQVIKWAEEWRNDLIKKNGEIYEIRIPYYEVSQIITTIKEGL